MSFPKFLQRLFANAGAGPKLLGSIIPFGTAAPKAPGTASAGSLDEVARADHVHALPNNATQSASGLMTASDKKKLDEIAAGATNTPSPVNMTGASTSAAGKAGYAPAPAAGAANRYLRSDGTWQVPPDNNTTYSNATQSAAGLMTAADKKKLDEIAAGATNTPAPVNMTGATTTAAGKAGYAPAPAAGAANRYLRSDGTWQIPPDNNTTYSAATQSAAGLMSAADKKKLDGMDANIPVPATATPAGTGVAAVGTSIKYAREDHVHPPKVTLKGTRSEDGNWTLTNCIVGAPLYILHSAIHLSAKNTASLRVKSGAQGGTTQSSEAWYRIGTETTENGNTTNCFITIPTSATVVLTISDSYSDFDIFYAYQ